MHIDPNAPGGNHRNHVLRMATNPGGGKIIVPEGTARQIAAQQARMAVPVMLSWCPMIGAHEVNEGQAGDLRQLPNMPPGALVPFFKCPTCGKEHMAATILVPVEDRPKPPVHAEPPITPEPRDDKPVEPEQEKGPIA